jgi:hypothetical protein
MSVTTAGQAAAEGFPYTIGDEVFVYDGGPGLITRVQGWALSVVEMAFGDGPEATLERRVAVFYNEDGKLDISSPLCVAPVEAASEAWHLVTPDGRIVGGGTRRQGRTPSLSREELEELRDEGTYRSLVGSVAVHGLPDGVRHAPSAEPADQVGSFIAARGGMYVWYVPTS